MSINPSFLIKKPSKTTGLSLVYVQAKWSGRRLLYSTGENILPTFWDKKKQRVKNNQATTKDGLHYLNDLIASMESVLINAYRKESVSGTPTIHQVKKHLDGFFEMNRKQEEAKQGIPTLYSLIDKFIKNEILYKGKQKSPATIKSYKTTLKHLREFEKKECYSICYDNITLQFFYSFVAYLRNRGMQQNALNKNIGVLKAFMSEAVDLGYTNNLEFRKKKFSIGQKLVDTIYLKEDEILILYHKCDLSYNKNLENVRDAFVIACYTGLRFSDFSTLKTEHVQEIDGELFIKKVTSKTGVEVIVPINSIVLEILNKYSGVTKSGLPKIPCITVFNKQIKAVCKAAELTETGRLSAEPEKALFECVSTHTGRRSFATNSFLMGIQTLDIMRITGHATEKSFMRYIRLSRLDAAKRFSHHVRMRSKPALRAVS